MPLKACLLYTSHGKHLVELKRELNKAVGYKGIQLVTISRPTAYGEYAPYHFVDTDVYKRQDDLKPKCDKFNIGYREEDSQLYIEYADLMKFYEAILDFMDRAFRLEPSISTKP